MRKIILTVISFIIVMNIAFASPHENGIDDFYFGQPIEEISSQYELTDREYVVEDGAVIFYKAEVPSLNFYGVEISQPVTLGFKNDKLYKIMFNTSAVSLPKAESQQNMIKNFASVQYGNSSLTGNRLQWVTDKISLFVTYNTKDDLAYLNISMNERDVPENISGAENIPSSVPKEVDIPVSVVEIPKDMNPIDAQLYVLYNVKLNSSLEDVSQQIYLTKNPSLSQMKNTDIISYTVPAKILNINGVNFKTTTELYFYKNRLESVFIMFDEDNTQLKEYLISKLGNPISETPDVLLGKYITCSWKNGDYGVNLLKNERYGHINFFYIPYVDAVSKISLLEYAEGLKSTPSTVRTLENLIRTNPQYKESFKNQVKNIPEYEQALKEAGMDMSVFD